MHTHTYTQWSWSCIQSQSPIWILSISFQRSVIGCTLQHTATHCNTLQHTATHCNNCLLQLELHSISISNLNLIGLFSTECGKRDLEINGVSLDVQPVATHCNTLEIDATPIAIGCISNDSKDDFWSLLLHSVEKRPIRFRLEIEIECHSNCNRLYIQWLQRWHLGIAIRPAFDFEPRIEILKSQLITEFSTLNNSTDEFSESHSTFLLLRFEDINSQKASSLPNLLHSVTTKMSFEKFYPTFLLLRFENFFSGAEVVEFSVEVRELLSMLE